MIYTGIKQIKDADMRKRTIDRLITLREQLDREIPGKTATNSLLLATWNIWKILRILSHFDGRLKMAI